MSSLHIDLVRSIQREFERFLLPLRELGLAQDSAIVDLVAGDLVMIGVFFAGADSNIAYEERNAINDMRRALDPNALSTIDSKDADDLYRQFIRLYPGRILSADCLPLTVKLLQRYDDAHGTSYARLASQLFAEVAEAVVTVDGQRSVYETITLDNFRNLLRTERVDWGQTEGTSQDDATA